MTAEATREAKAPTAFQRVAAAWKWLIRPSALACAAIFLFGAAFILCTLALNSGSEDKTSDWISAFGTAFGAALTGGALLVAAFTYRHQVDERIRIAADNRKAQARAVSVSIRKKPGYDKMLQIQVLNNSNLSINSVFLILLDKKRRECHQETYHLMVPGSEEGFDRDERIVGAAYANFIDADGRRWRSWFNGDLEER
ncbi:hypothetical protein [Paenarthrobacter sp. YIM B13468]|uniref:hypothetical protein n=1 Tax=Paenarthrobacter sp. YIM B13468 TaxID=3366295 RepID=UPI00366AD659